MKQEQLFSTNEPIIAKSENQWNDVNFIKFETVRNGLSCANVPLRNYSLTHSQSDMDFMQTLRDVCIRASDKRGLREPRTLSSLDVTTKESSSEPA